LIKIYSSYIIRKKDLTNGQIDDNIGLS